MRQYIASVELCLMLSLLKQDFQYYEYLPNIILVNSYLMLVKTPSTSISLNPNRLLAMDNVKYQIFVTTLDRVTSCSDTLKF